MKKEKIFLAVFFLAITIGTKTASAQEKPNTPWTGDIHNVALQSKANFLKGQFFVSQMVWLTKNDKPIRVEFVEKGKQKGKTRVIDLRYRIDAEKKGTIALVDSMPVTFINGSTEVKIIIPVLWISFNFGSKKKQELIKVPFVLKPSITTAGVLDWRKCSSCQFEIAPFFSVSGNDFTKKQEGVDYYRVTDKAVAEVDKESLQQFKVAKDLKVQ